MSRARFGWWWRFAALALAWPLAASADGVMLIKKTDAQPRTGQEVEAGVGGVIYAESEYPAQIFARLLEDVTVTAKGDVLKKGTTLQGEVYNGREMYCSLDLYRRGPWRVRVLCLLDPDGDARFESLHLVDYVPPRSYPLDVPYEIVHLPTQLKLAEAWRRELIYQGIGGGVLRLAYREYLNNLVRSAFSQEATYELAEGATEIVFMSVRIEVLGADNAGMRYRVLEGFIGGS